MHEAIKRAVEGGYNQSKEYPNARKGYVEINTALLDPTFWQCLGKSLGWGFDYLVDPSDYYAQDEWEDKWHKFIAHIAEGKSPDSFFEELFNKN